MLENKKKKRKMLVNTKEGLERLLSILNNEKEFAIDLEHNNQRSFLGITCLIQISTRTTDYIVDPFPIWDELPVLNEPFTNPDILKVFLLIFQAILLYNSGFPWRR